MPYFYQINEPESIGGRLGSSLGQGLQTLAQHKIGEVQQRKQKAQTAKGLMALGYPQEEATQLAHLDPDTLRAVVQQNLKSSAQSVSTAPGLRAIIPGLSEDDASKISALSPGLQLEYFRNYLQNPYGQEQQFQNPQIQAPQQEMLQPNMIGQSQQPIQPGANLNAVKQEIKPIEKPKVQPKKMVEPKISKVNAPKLVEKRLELESADAIPKEDYPVVAKETPKQEVEQKLEPTAPKQARLTPKEQTEILKRNYKKSDEIDEEYQTALKTLHNTQKLSRLIKEGNLPGNFQRNFATSVANIFGALPFVGKQAEKAILGVFERSAPVAEFNAIIQELVKDDAKRYKGQGSVSDYEQRLRLASFPSWVNDPLGNARLIDSLNNRAEEKVVMHDAKNKVRKKNGGKLPIDFDEQIEIEAAPAKQKLFNKYRYGRKFINLPLPADLPVGFEVTDSDTGIKYRNNGNEFVVVDGPGFTAS